MARSAWVAKPMNEFTVDHTRAWTGLWVVIGGDVAIAVAAILAVLKISSGGADAQSMVSILSSAFTAIGTMTTAYFGIRAVSNTAQHSLAAHSPSTAHPADKAPAVDPPDDAPASAPSSPDGPAPDPGDASPTAGPVD